MIKVASKTHGKDDRECLHGRKCVCVCIFDYFLPVNANKCFPPDLQQPVLCFFQINFIQMQWKLGEAMCKLVPVVQGTNIFVGTGTVMAIALDRYFTIVRSKGAPQDSNRVLLSIALIWIVSCLFTLPIIFYQVLEEVCYAPINFYLFPPLLLPTT